MGNMDSGYEPSGSSIYTTDSDYSDYDQSEWNHESLHSSDDEYWSSNSADSEYGDECCLGERRRCGHCISTDVSIFLKYDLQRVTANMKHPDYVKSPPFVTDDNADNPGTEREIQNRVHTWFEMFDLGALVG